ncbi:hypothetical protein RRG08_067410 [Elysia crispata]|uniref:Uncharacterized protein n=1 Tax=Elysia crispata TaxID=231223 RepID=A0AAE1DXZ6_9GAST|nr:hypothetical protein RRG08_067410 [Elysia crispata]
MSRSLFFPFGADFHADLIAYSFYTRSSFSVRLSEKMTRGGQIFGEVTSQPRADTGTNSSQISHHEAPASTALPN